MLVIQTFFQTKAAFTRTYNKEVHMTPYSTGAVAKKRRGAAPVDTDDLLGEEEGGGGEGYGAAPEEEEEEDDSLEADTMIKVSLVRFRVTTI